MSEFVLFSGGSVIFFLQSRCDKSNGRDTMFSDKVSVLNFVQATGRKTTFIPVKFWPIPFWKLMSTVSVGRLLIPQLNQSQWDWMNKIFGTDHSGTNTTILFSDDEACNIKGLKINRIVFRLCLVPQTIRPFNVFFCQEGENFCRSPCYGLYILFPAFWCEFNICIAFITYSSSLDVVFTSVGRYLSFILFL